MFVAGTKPDLREFLATLPPEDEANEVVVPAQFDPLSIRRADRTASRSLVAVLTESLPGARRSRPRR